MTVDGSEDRSAVTCLALESLGMARLGVMNQQGRATPVLDIGKPLALIVYLAAAPKSSASREHSLDLLWADLEPDAAKHALRQTLWYIKRKVGEQLITTDGDQLVLSASIESDRAQLIAAAEHGDHAKVIELYKGDFLPGFAAPGGAEFEQWADIERRRLRNLFYRSAEQEVHRNLTSGRARDAVALARRARDLDGTHQPAWRVLLEALIAAADSTGAQMEADALEARASADEMDLEPPTRALIRLARQTPNTPADPSTPKRTLVAELVGRAREFAQMLGAWEDARAGHGRHVHIRAAAGFGKTRLLDDLHARLRSTRARVRIVRLRIGTRDVPYVAAAEIAAALCELPGAKGISTESATVLLALNPTLSSVFQSSTAEHSQGADALRRRTVALRELLVAVSEDHPIALLVDDLHWIDQPSRTVFAHLSTNIEGSKVLLVTTSRPAPTGRLDAGHNLALDLPPLDAETIHALVTSIAGLPDTSWVTTFTQELTRSSLGSPLRTLETLQLLLDHGLLERGAEGWGTHDPDALLLALRSGDALTHRLSELGRTEAWLLLLLSIAGVPTPQSILYEVSQRSETDCSHAVAALEAHGFITRQADTLAPAHDEIAEASIELATDDAQRAAHTSLGSYLWQRRDADLPTLRRAAGHLARTDEPVALRATYLRFVRESRALGDHRPHVALADDMLGSLTSARRVRELVRSLPLHVRLGLTSGRRIAAAVALVTLAPIAIAGAIAATARSEPPPDAELVIFHMGNRGPEAAYTAALRGSDWPVEAMIKPTRDRSVRVPAVESAFPPLNVPGRRNQWVYAAPVSDSGVIDIFVEDGSGHRRLTHAKGDDGISDISPDGRLAAITSGRWSEMSRYGIGIVDLASGATRRLTTSSGADSDVHWSSDGSRIVFQRRSFEELSRYLCYIRFDGTGERCLTNIGGFLSVAGWIDASHVLILRGSSARPGMAIVDLRTDSVTATTEDLSARTAVVSPNGKFVACACAARGSDDWRWLVFPVGRVQDAREVAGALDTDRIAVRWRAPGNAGGVTNLTIAPIPPNLSLGVPYQFRAHGKAADGRTVEVADLRWYSSAPATIAVDSITGVAVARRLGEATLTVDAGGWTVRSATLSTAVGHANVLFSEDWTGGLGRSWIAFGAPAPYVDTSSAPHVLMPNGDGSYESGVLSRLLFDVRDGIALDADVSAPITFPQWQRVGVSIQALDSALWTEAERQRGSLGFQSMSCAVAYPAGENSAWRDSIHVGTGTGSLNERVTAPQGASKGAWIRLRLQILPDGRCGVAVNGTPVYLAPIAVTYDPNARAAIYGSSFRTQVRVGRVTVWQGVPNDIDWAAFQRTRNKRHE